MVSQLLRAVAVLVKSSVSDGTFEQATVVMMGDAKQMMEAEGSPAIQAIGLRTLTGLLDEFDVGNAGGSSAAFDDSCRSTFEAPCLKPDGVVRHHTMLTLILLTRTGLGYVARMFHAGTLPLHSTHPRPSSAIPTPQT